MPINFPSNPTNNQTYTSGDTSWVWNGTVWNVVGSSGATVSSTGFSSIVVDGQTSVVAENSEDALKIIAGSNITISTDNVEKSITINSTAESSGETMALNSFSTIAVTGQANVVADSSTDTLTLIAGTGISITSNVTNDSITINNSATSFSTLTDATTSSLTVDKFYLPAMTMLVVTNSGASAYRFDQYGTTDNPTIFAITGMTIAFDLNATGHPFLIQNPAGVNFNTGLVHVTPTGVVSTGAAAQGKDSGTLYWKVPTDISGGYRYQCSIHAPMVGSITVKTIGTL